MEFTDRTTVYIYALVDPRDGETRYVGQAVNVRDRLRYHIKDRARTHKTNWIKEVRAAGFRPTFKILEEATGTNCNEREIWWIASLREQGCKLTNGTAGGEGTRNRVWTPEQRAFVSNLNKGRKLTAEQIAKSLQTKREIGDWHGPSPSLHKRYIVISPEGVEQEISNLYGFCREHGLNCGNMNRVAHGHNKHHRGWKCSPYQDPT